MSYPCIKKDEGIALYKRIIENGESYDSVKNKINEVTYQKDNGNFKIELAEMSIEEILEKNKNIQFLDDQNNIAKPARFERFASVILHKTLNLDNVIAFDQEFWIWFSFFSKKSLKILNDRIKTNTPTKYSVDGRIVDSEYFRTWYRADILYDELNEVDYYELAQFEGTDLYKSFIYGLAYSYNKSFIRAFIKFCLSTFSSSDLNNKSIDTKAKVEGVRIRDLGPELIKRNCLYSFDAMSQSEAYNFISKVWQEKGKWNRNS